MAASPAWQQVSSVWIIVGNDDVSGDEVIIALSPLSLGVGGAVWWPAGGSFFPESSFGFVRFVSMSQSDSPELFFSFC